MAVKELKQLLNDEKQKAIQEYLESLTASEATDYSLWKATIRLKQEDALHEQGTVSHYSELT